MPALVAAPRLILCVALSAFSLCRPAQPGVTRGVEETLRGMTQAVLAGDSDAYLGWVWTGDPIFLTEQRNWAADLTAHAPAEFSLTLDPDTLSVEDERAAADLTMRWRMPPDDTGRTTGWARELSIPVRFIRGDTPLGAGWLFAGEDWTVLDNPEARVRVMCMDGFQGVADAAADIFPEVRAHVEAGFEVALDGVQEIKLYADMEHLQASIYLSYSDPLSGWNEPGESIKILASGMVVGGVDDEGRPEDEAQTKAQLKPLLAHEFGHVATFEYGDAATDMPWWVVEGAAELAAERFRPGAAALAGQLCAVWARVEEAAVHGGGNGGGLAPWEAITDFRTTEPRWMMHVYAQGQHMLGYISERWGRAGRNRWLRSMARGASLDAATREVMGTSFADLDAAWRASLLPTDEPEDGP